VKRTAIVTDLTRFKKQDIVCIAAIEISSGVCIRPLPYLQAARCRELNILPGTIIEGDFVKGPDLTGPHQEDCSFTDISHLGACSATEFENILVGSLSDSIEQGFSVEMDNGQKFIPHTHAVDRSIITLQVDPSCLAIVEDSYKPGKIRLNLTDKSGRSYRYLSITDLGFHDYAIQHHARGDLRELNNFLQSQREIYIRVGLSRSHSAPDGRHGYWLQANGIYTFPNFLEKLRSYS
jgi:hypothetical protein